MPNDQDPGRSLVEDYTRLLSLAVHEFRTPASVVGGYLRMLQSEAGGPLTDYQRKMIQEAEKSCDRLVALISELSEIARLDAGSAATRPEAFDVFHMMREAARDVRDAEDRVVPVSFSGEVAGAPCTGDRLRLQGALTAIVRAIARERITGAAIAIDCRLVADHDHGDEIDDVDDVDNVDNVDNVDHRDHVLAAVIIARDQDAQAAFTAPREAFDERRGGLGLALPIARRVIERHGGLIWSPAVGAPGDAARRAAVVVTLPLT